MLTYTSLGTSLDSSSVYWTLQFRYVNVCTAFDHPQGSGTFTGAGQLGVGEAWAVAFTNSTQLGTAPAVIMSLTSIAGLPTYSSPFAAWVMINSSVSNPYGSVFPWAGTISSTLWLAAAFTGTFVHADSIVGTVSGAATLNSTFTPESGAASRPFSLTRGGACPV